MMLNCRAQQETLFTQYVYNELTINPAYAGYHGVLNLSLNSRKQWIGLEGSPFTTTFAAHTVLNGKSQYYNNTSRNRQSLGRNTSSQTGLGCLVYIDRIGVDNTLQSNFAYSHKIIFPNSRLSFGLQGSVIYYDQNFFSLEQYNSDDPVFAGNTQKTMFNFGTGIFFDNDRYYFGVSVPQLIENYLDVTESESNKQLRQYFFTGGYLMYLNEDFKFKPSFMCRYSSKIPYQLDLNGMIIYRDKIFAGLSYRNKDMFSTIFQVKFDDKLRIGIAYDYTFGMLKVATNGSVEVMINYSFQNAVHKIVDPRYF